MKKDPFQMDNLIGKHLLLHWKASMETILMKKLARGMNAFLRRIDYMTQWNYLYDRERIVFVRLILFGGKTGKRSLNPEIAKNCA